MPFLRPQVRAITLTAAVALLLAYGQAVPSSAGAAGKAASPPVAQAVSTDLSTTVGADGRFSQGTYPDGNGDPGTGSFNTLYGWPSTGSSFSTIRVDGVDSVFGDSTGSIEPQDPQVFPWLTSTTWDKSPVSVDEILDISADPATGAKDVAQIVYSVTNTSSVAHSVGVRALLDTDVNGNDAPTFVLPSQGAVTTEQDLAGAAVPAGFQVFDSLSDSQHVATATLNGGGAPTPPDRLVIASYPRLSATPWNFTSQPGTSLGSDNAFAVYWNPVSVAAGATQDFRMYYGLGNLDEDLNGPYSLQVSGPDQLLANGGQYEPNPFTVTADLQNTGTTTENDVVLNLVLPANLHTLSQNPVPAGNLAAGAKTQASWQVTADPSATATTVGYSVQSLSQGAVTKGVVASVALPALGGLPSAPTGVTAVSTAENTAKVSWTAPSSSGGGAITGYLVTSSTGVTSTVSAPATSVVLPASTDNCTQDLSYTVRAENGAGAGAVSVASAPITTEGWPDAQPTKVVILVDGLASNINGGTFDPGATQNCALYQRRPNAPLADLGFYWHQGADSKFIAHPIEGMLDSLAETGAVILPYSYNGAKFEGSGSHQFTVNGYGTSVPGAMLPLTAAQELVDEVGSVESVYPAAKITIIGHSEGGAVAQALWSLIGSDPHLAKVFSLDSPVNGVAAGGKLVDVAQSTGLYYNALGAMSMTSDLANYYSTAWDDRSSNDAHWISADSTDRYVALGSVSDALYNFADVFADDGKSYPGLDSQLLWSPFPAGAARGQPYPPMPALAAPDHLVPTPAGMPNLFKALLGGEPLISHFAVMQSDDAIETVVGTVYGDANSAAQAHAQAGAAQPAPVGGAFPAGVTTAGSTVTITGGDFGSSPGDVEFSKAGSSYTVGPTTAWSDTSITVKVPSDAVTGPVIVDTAAGASADVGTALIAGAANGVASLGLAASAAAPVNGDAVTFTVTAKNASGTGLSGVPVTISDGEPYSVVTAAGGTASLTLHGFGPEHLTAISGGHTATLNETWVAAPAEVLSLPSTATATDGNATLITAKVTNAAGAPVAGRTVAFSVAGASGAAMSVAHAVTDASGHATSSLSTSAAGDYLVTATINNSASYASEDVTYSSANAPPLQPTVACTTCQGTTQAVNGAVLSARSVDPDGDNVTLRFRLMLNQTGFPAVASSGLITVPSGATATWAVPAGTLQAGAKYVFQADVEDAQQQGPSSQFGYLNVPAAAGVQLRGAPSSDATTGGRNYLKIATPPGAVTGDLLVADVTVTADSTVTAPAGWTVLSGWPRADGTQTWAAKQYVFTHWLTAADVGPYQFNTNGPGGYVASDGLIVAASGVSTTQPLTSHWAPLSSGTSLGVLPTASTAGALQLALSSATNGFATSTTTTAPAPFAAISNVTEPGRDSAVAAAGNQPAGQLPQVVFYYSQDSQAVATMLELPPA